MPVQIVTGDIFESGVDVLVNPVNCVGVMGAGLAREFKRRWPKMFREYKTRCATDRLSFGRVLLWEMPSVDGRERWIANVPTKNHYSNPSTLAGVGLSLHALRFHIDTMWAIDGREDSQGPTVAMPALGCGLGGLEFHRVLTLIRLYFDSAPYTVRVYRPR